MVESITNAAEIMEMTRNFDLEAYEQEYLEEQRLREEMESRPTCRYCQEKPVELHRQTSNVCEECSQKLYDQKVRAEMVMV